MCDNYDKADEGYILEKYKEVVEEKETIRRKCIPKPDNIKNNEDFGNCYTAEIKEGSENYNCI